MVSTTSLNNLFFYFFFLTILVMEVYSFDKCLLLPTECDACFCECDKAGRSNCGLECEPSCIPE